MYGVIFVLVEKQIFSRDLIKRSMKVIMHFVPRMMDLKTFGASYERNINFLLLAKKGDIQIFVKEKDNLQKYLDWESSF